MISLRLWRSLQTPPVWHPAFRLYSDPQDTLPVMPHPANVLFVVLVLLSCTAFIPFSDLLDMAVSVWLPLVPFLPLFFSIYAASLATQTTITLAEQLARQRQNPRWELFATLPDGVPMLCGMFAVLVHQRSRNLLLVNRLKRLVRLSFVVATALLIVLGVGGWAVYRASPSAWNADLAFVFVVLIQVYALLVLPLFDLIQAHALAVALGTRIGMRVRPAEVRPVTLAALVGVQALTGGVGVAFSLVFLVQSLANSASAWWISLAILDAALRVLLICGLRELVIARLLVWRGEPLVIVYAPGGRR